MPKKLKQAEGTFLLKGNQFVQRRDGDVGKVVLVFDWDTKLSDDINALAGKRVKCFITEFEIQEDLQEED